MKIITDVTQLRRKSQPINADQMAGVGLEDKLTRTLLANGGVGLAAIQINLPIRAFLMRLNAGKFLMVYNPRILKAYDKMVFLDEGCLSFPGERITTERYKHIEVEFGTSEGKMIKAVFSDLEAVIFQHEYDHLEGITMHDRKRRGQKPMERSKKKIGRNTPCPCRSGKKYKRCCLNKLETSCDVW